MGRCCSCVSTSRFEGSIASALIPRESGRLALAVCSTCSDAGVGASSRCGSWCTPRGDDAEDGARLLLTEACGASGGGGGMAAPVAAAAAMTGTAAGTFAAGGRGTARADGGARVCGSGPLGVRRVSPRSSLRPTIRGAEALGVRRAADMRRERGFPAVLAPVGVRTACKKREKKVNENKKCESFRHGRTGIQKECQRV